MKTIPACLMLLLLAAAGHAAEPLDLTTGREVTVPVEVHGSYQLVAANGRVLAAGTADGCPAFYLAALKPGASEQVDLIADNIKQPLVLHSPRPLAGLKARFDLRPALRRTLLDAGLSAAGECSILFTDTLSGDGSARLQLLFPTRSDLPLALPENWREIRMVRAKIPGTLGVLYREKQETIDRTGRASYIELRDGRRRLIVFSPEFDPARLENIILIQTILKEMK